MSGSSTRGPVLPQGWDWLWGMLFDAVGDTRIKLNVPDTVLLSDKGAFVRWLGTARDGRLVRKAVPAGDAAPAAVRFAFEVFLEEAETPVSEDLPFAVAWFRDPRREPQIVTLKAFDRLAQHSVWLAQLYALQPYPLRMAEYSGVFVRNQKSSAAISKLLSLPKLPYQPGPALDAITGQLAQHAPPNLQVVAMTAHYYMDMVNRLWLSHASEVATQLLHKFRPAPLVMSDRMAKVVAREEMVRAADAAEAAFRTLLQAGWDKGLDHRRTFRHFDVMELGTVTPAQFADGLRLLGFNIHPAAMDVFVSRVPRDRAGLIGLKQFIIFCEPPDAGLDTGVPPLASTSSLKSVRQLARSASRRSSLASHEAGEEGDALRPGTAATPLSPILSARGLDSVSVPQSMPSPVKSHSPPPASPIRDVGNQWGSDGEVTPPKSAASKPPAGTPPRTPSTPSAPAPTPVKPSPTPVKPSPSKASVPKWFELVDVPPPSQPPPKPRTPLAPVAAKAPPPKVPPRPVSRPAAAAADPESDMWWESPALWRRRKRKQLNPNPTASPPPRGAVAAAAPSPVKSPPPPGTAGSQPPLKSRVSFADLNHAAAAEDHSLPPAAAAPTADTAEEARAPAQQPLPPAGESKAVEAGGEAKPCDGGDETKAGGEGDDVVESLHLDSVPTDAVEVPEGDWEAAQATEMAIDGVEDELVEITDALRLGRRKAILVGELVSRTQAALEFHKERIRQLKASLVSGTVDSRDLGSDWGSEDERLREGAEDDSEDNASDDGFDTDEDDDANVAIDDDDVQHRTRVTEAMKERVIARIAKEEVNLAFVIRSLKSRRTEKEDIKIGLRALVAAKTTRRSKVKELVSSLPATYTRWRDAELQTARSGGGRRGTARSVAIMTTGRRTSRTARTARSAMTVRGDPHRLFGAPYARRTDTQRIGAAGTGVGGSDGTGGAVLGVGRINVDVDGRARELLHELDRSQLLMAMGKRFMDTAVLHGAAWRYKAEVVQVDLERELDRVLLTQVFEREHLDRALAEKRRAAIDGSAEAEAVDKAKAEAAAAAQAKADEDRELDEFSKLSADELLQLSAADRTRLRLAQLDRELRVAHGATTDYVEVFAVHNHRQMIWREDAVIVLEREVDKIVATAVAAEVVDGILDWMLEGWVFGERKSNKVHVVPGQAGAGGAGDASEDGAPEVRERSRAPAKPKPVPGVLAEARVAGQKVVEANAKVGKVVDEVERTMRFGLLLLSMHYFRAMSLLQQQKDIWGGERSLAAMRGEPGADSRTTERLRMEKAEANRKLRQATMEAANARAQAGFARRQRLRDRETRLGREELLTTLKRRKQEVKAVVLIQSWFRGHVARLAISKWAREKREVDARRALVQAAAVAIQSAWRGYVGRQIAAELRRELAVFMRMVRQRHEVAEVMRSRSGKDAAMMEELRMG